MFGCQNIFNYGDFFADFLDSFFFLFFTFLIIGKGIISNFLDKILQIFFYFIFSLSKLVAECEASIFVFVGETQQNEI